MGRQPLCDAFPDLYSIVGSKGAKATKLWVREDGGGAWDLKFLRPFNDWELDAIQDFIGETSNFKISPLEKDKLFWEGDESGSFTVKAYFKHLEGVYPHKVCYRTSISLLKLFFSPGKCVGVRFLPQLN